LQDTVRKHIKATLFGGEGAHNWLGNYYWYCSAKSTSKCILSQEIPQKFSGEGARPTLTGEGDTFRSEENEYMHSDSWGVNPIYRHTAWCTPCIHGLAV